MKYSFATLIFTLFASLILSACASMNSKTEKKTLCRTLKNDIMFNGATSNTRRSEMQSADKPLEQRTYQANCE